jgi:hypothetical protein
VFDPATEKFIQVESMAHGRYYATVTALGDGGLMVFSGKNEFNKINGAPKLIRRTFTPIARSCRIFCAILISVRQKILQRFGDRSVSSLSRTFRIYSAA